MRIFAHGVCSPGGSVSSSVLDQRPSATSGPSGGVPAGNEKAIAPCLERVVVPERIAVTHYG